MVGDLPYGDHCPNGSLRIFEICDTTIQIDLNDPLGEAAPVGSGGLWLLR